MGDSDRGVFCSWLFGDANWAPGDFLPNESANSLRILVKGDGKTFCEGMGMGRAGPSGGASRVVVSGREEGCGVGILGGS